MQRVTKKTRKHADDLRAASRLVVDATTRVTEVVEAMHTTIAGGPAMLGKPLSGPARVINGLVYGSIRGVSHAGPRQGGQAAGENGNMLDSRN